MEKTLLVSTDEMRAQADAVQKAIGTMTQEFNNFEALVNNTAYYWTGEAADAFRAVYASQKDAIAAMLRRLNEDMNDLYQMAGLYDKTVIIIQEKVETMPDIGDM